MIVIFTKACVYNRYKRKVGNITTLLEKDAAKAIKDGIVKPYTGDYPPKKKTKINLNELK